MVYCQDPGVVQSRSPQVDKWTPRRTTSAEKRSPRRPQPQTTGPETQRKKIRRRRRSICSILILTCVSSTQQSYSYTTVGINLGDKPSLYMLRQLADTQASHIVRLQEIVKRPLVLVNLHGSIPAQKVIRVSQIQVTFFQVSGFQLEYTTTGISETPSASVSS